jgi:SAM-dependent methyltransferase
VAPAKSIARPLDRFDLYELCVQSPGDLVPLLEAIHGGRPSVLGEDFCGTAALSRRWAARVAGGRAIAVDHDPEPLARAAGAARVEVVRGDVVADTSGRRADVVYAGNFSIGERHDRPALLEYLRHARSRLDAGGVFVCDVYGGESAFQTGRVTREHRAADGRVVRYTWEQRRADPTTGRVVNALHFEVVRDGVVERALHDAFVYDWRLWGVPELRDAMIEAGYATTEVYLKVPDAADGDGKVYAAPIDDPSDLDNSFDVLVAARSSPDH